MEMFEIHGYSLNLRRVIECGRLAGCGPIAEFEAATDDHSPFDIYSSMIRWLSEDAKNPARIHLIGLVSLEVGLVDQAIRYLQRAATARLEDPNCLVDLARALGRRGKTSEADALCSTLLVAFDVPLDALVHVAEQYREWGRHEESLSLLKRLSALSGDIERVLIALGEAQYACGQKSAACSSAVKSCRLYSRSPLGFYLLGVICKIYSKPNWALHCFEHVLSLDDSLSMVWFNYGWTLRECRRIEEALNSYSRVHKQSPLFLDAKEEMAALYNQHGDDIRAIECLLDRADALYKRGDFDESLLAFRQLTEEVAHEARVVAMIGAGRSLQALNRPREALAFFDAAIRERPTSANLHYQKALCLLKAGEWRSGWYEYQWRQEALTATSRARDYCGPLWQGQDIDAKTLMLHAEQGLGDTIQFIRFANLLKARGATIILRCQKRLVPLLVDVPYLDSVVDQDGPPSTYDFQVPLMSLPSLLNTSLDSIPNSVPYLFVSDEVRSRWKKRIRVSEERFRVGLVWAGNPDNMHDRQRSMRLADLAALAYVPNLILFSLQRGSAASQLLIPPVDLRVVSVHQAGDGIEDTGAVIGELDLVLSVDTMVAHLAGSLAVPVWVLLPFSPDWRYHTVRTDNPWYPTMRLFRQGRMNDWSGVVSGVATTLSEITTDPVRIHAWRQLRETGAS